MEITKEIKEKVYSQHLWAPVKCTGGVFHANQNSKRNGATVMSAALLADIIDGTFKFSDFVFRLKPLSSVNDEQAEEVGKILGFKYKPKENGLAFLKELSNGKEMFFKFHPLNTLAVFEYLRSHWYDLPNYHLDGNTLQESGLAIYE